MVATKLLMKPRVYLDTSIVSAYFDVRTVERMTVTREFWRQSDKYILATSTLTWDELNATPDSGLRKQFDEVARDVDIIALTEEMNEVARQYIDAGAFALKTVAGCPARGLCGLNSRCPCGSGKKFKKCCGKMA